MVASSGKEMRDSHTFRASIGGKSDIRLLRSAVIYGANASGKSNFLNAMGAMNLIVLTSASENHPGKPISVTPFRLDPATRNKPSEFEVDFIAGGVRYQYGFSSTQERIVEEWLLAYPHGRAQTWLEREWNGKKKEYNWRLGTALKGEKNLWKNATRENALFLSSAVQWNSQQLLPVYKWITEKFICVMKESVVGSVVNVDSHVTSLYCAHGGKEDVVEFLRHADLDIHDVQVMVRSLEFFNEAEKLPDVGDLADFLTTFYRMMEMEQVYEVKVVHNDIRNQPVMFNLHEESAGTRRLYSYAGYWLTKLKTNSVVIVDELHQHLHPKLVQYLVGMFNSEKTNPNNAQLIFVTHETAFMDREILRRDQIWFCEINSRLATEVYPLTDFHPRRGRGDLRRAYRSGGYGALPHIKEAIG